MYQLNQQQTQQNAPLNFQADPSLMFREPQIFRKCELITQHLNVHSAKELQLYYGQLVENLFEYNLANIHQRNSALDYQSLVNILAPGGAVFQLAEKLSREVATPRILYPLYKLPQGLQEQLVRQTVSPYIAHKVSLDGQYLQLNPVESFLFLLIGHVLDPRAAEVKMDLNNWPTVVYFTLLEMYLSHFLDSDSSHDCTSSSILASIGTRFHPCGRPVGQGHRCLLKKDALLMGSGKSFTLNSSSLLSANNKASTLLNIVSELWLSSNKGVHDNQQLLRAVRIILRKLHSCGYFESNYLPQFKRRLYSFVKSTLLTWPLDSTYRLPMETWLTFIQPWRYSLAESPSGQYIDAAHDRYKPFIKDHLLFYTQLLLVTLDRISVLDLSLPSNAVLINRICRVFSQDGLMNDIMNLETPICVNQSVNECEAAGYTFVQLQSEEWRNKARELIRSLQHGARRLERKIAQLEKSFRERNWWGRVMATIIGEVEPSTSTECKTLQQVLSSIDKLAVIFRVDIPEMSHCYEEDMRVEDSIESTLNSSKRKLFDQRYLGIPEKQPPRSNEFQFLLPYLARYSIQINTHYGHRIRDIYYQQKVYWTSFLLMYIIYPFVLPPAAYIEIQKDRDFLSPRKHMEVRLPPRVYLRVLAKDSVVYTAVVCVGLLYLFGLKLCSVMSMVLFLMKLFVEKLYILFNPPEPDMF